MEFVIDPQMPAEELAEIGSFLGEILAIELDLNPKEVRVEVQMAEDEDDPEMVTIEYVIRVRGESPSELEMYRACELFNRIMHVSDEGDPYSIN
jgi:hypothetical protein